VETKTIYIDGDPISTISVEDSHSGTAMLTIDDGVMSVGISMGARDFLELAELLSASAGHMIVFPALRGAIEDFFERGE